jgi:hypothetical protein
MTDTVQAPETREAHRPDADPGTPGTAHPDGDAVARDLALRALRVGCRGRVLLPADAGFAQSAAPWNRAVAQAPLAIVEVADAADVVTAVRLARTHGLAVSAQPGGHGATASAADDVVLLRTGALDEIWLDADAQVARVGAGVKWGALLEALDGSGLIGLAGSNPDVSVVGYLLGGGMSWFGRRHGVAARAVRAVELVDGSGVHRWVSDRTDQDLMWALRGGGGEFGIVTRVELDLQGEPELHGGMLMFPISEAHRVLMAFGAVTAAAPDGLTCWASIMHFPDLPDMPPVLRGQSFCVVNVTWLGPADRLPSLLAPLRSAGPLVSDSVGPVPIGRLGEVAAEPTDPTPGIDWSTMLSGLDDEVVERILAAVGDRSATALSVVQLRHLGGALRDPGVASHDIISTEPHADPRPGCLPVVEGEYLVYALGIPAVPELAGPIRRGLAELAAAVEPVSLGRTPLTMLGSGGSRNDVYEPAALDRLREVKHRVDPRGVIRSNHPLG